MNEALWDPEFLLTILDDYLLNILMVMDEVFTAQLFDKILDLEKPCLPN